MTAIVPTAAAHPHGEKIGDCQIVRKVFEGGMGVVYEAQDLRLMRTVAIKVISGVVTRHEDRLQRFTTEARLLAALEHPNVVQVYQLGQMPNGAPFLVMQWIDGESVGVRIKHHGAVPVIDAIEILIQAAHGLFAAHSQGIVHRDVKPDNILLKQDGMVKVADFGLARSDKVDLVESQPGAIVGTPAFMAPEQLDGRDVDPRTDIYSLALTAFHILTGYRPFVCRTLPDLLAAQMRQPLPSIQPYVNHRLAYELDDLLQRMSAKNPADRPQSMLDVIDPLESLLLAMRHEERKAKSGSSSRILIPRAALEIATRDAVPASSRAHDTPLASDPARAADALAGADPNETRSDDNAAISTSSRPLGASASDISLAQQIAAASPHGATTITNDGTDIRIVSSSDEQYVRSQMSESSASNDAPPPHRSNTSIIAPADTAAEADIPSADEASDDTPAAVTPDPTPAAEEPCSIPDAAGPIVVSEHLSRAFHLLQWLDANRESLHRGSFVRRSDSEPIGIVTIRNGRIAYMECTVGDWHDRLRLRDPLLANWIAEHGRDDLLATLSHETALAHAPMDKPTLMRRVGDHFAHELQALIEAAGDQGPLIRTVGPDPTDPSAAPDASAEADSRFTYTPLVLMLSLSANAEAAAMADQTQVDVRPDEPTSLFESWCDQSDAALLLARPAAGSDALPLPILATGLDDHRLRDLAVLCRAATQMAPPIGSDEDANQPRLTTRIDGPIMWAVASNPRRIALLRVPIGGKDPVQVARHLSEMLHRAPFSSDEVTYVDPI